MHAMKEKQAQAVSLFQRPLWVALFALPVTLVREELRGYDTLIETARELIRK